MDTSELLTSTLFGRAPLLAAIEARLAAGGGVALHGPGGHRQDRAARRGRRPRRARGASWCVRLRPAAAERLLPYAGIADLVAQLPEAAVAALPPAHRAALAMLRQGCRPAPALRRWPAAWCCRACSRTAPGAGRCCWCSTTCSGSTRVGRADRLRDAPPPGPRVRVVAAQRRPRAPAGPAPGRPALPGPGGRSAGAAAGRRTISPRCSRPAACPAGRRAGCTRPAAATRSWRWRSAPRSPRAGLAARAAARGGPRAAARAGSTRCRRRSPATLLVAALATEPTADRAGAGRPRGRRPGPAARPPRPGWCELDGETIRFTPPALADRAGRGRRRGPPGRGARRARQRGAGRDRWPPGTGRCAAAARTRTWPATWSPPPSGRCAAAPGVRPPSCTCWPPTAARAVSPPQRFDWLVAAARHRRRPRARPRSPGGPPRRCWPPPTPRPRTGSGPGSCCSTWPGRRWPTWARRSPAALDEAGDDPALLAPVRLRLTWAAMLGGDAERGRGARRRVGPGGRTAGDPTTEAMALSALAQVQRLRGRAAVDRHAAPGAVAARRRRCRAGCT